MKVSSCGLSTIAAIVLFASSGAAQNPEAPVQDRRFLFSVSTLPVERPRATVQVDSGFGERAFDVSDSDRPEQRLSVQAFLGHRLTFLGKVGVSTDESDLRSSQQGELMYSVVRMPKVEGSLAVGMGIRHEPSGVNVLLGRVDAGRAFNSLRIDGNALFEKPYATGRDAMDLITTMGVSRRLNT